ncbi:hypothetical protein A9563_22945 [Salmonella enterica subsp. enterica serovar Rubislaw]|nr:hypothetical protein [Salmonella enterica subsp. enterica serovar Rubislaw]EDX0903924.1 hypothetical protein [Salmonella enterica subsp. enterica]EEG5393801.1 hypothetical protein [Salmonella enterica subsp. enterica]EEG5546753.1 hypothetical protein [Salmonella enterica subsp. enterica]
MVNIILNMILCILSAYHIFCGVSVTQIRKLQVPDLRSFPPRPELCNHNMCHSVSSILFYMLCYAPSQ